MKGSRQRTSAAKRTTSSTKRITTASSRNNTSISSLSAASSIHSVSTFNGSAPSTAGGSFSRTMATRSAKHGVSAVTSKRSFASSSTPRDVPSFGFSASTTTSSPQRVRASIQTTTAPVAMPTRLMSSKVKAINCPEAPSAVGPYSHATVANGMVYVSGQLPLDPKTMKFNSDDDVSLQAHQCLKNLETILHTAQSDLKHVTKTTILLNDIADFPKVNKVYAEYFTEHLPARICYAVDKLPLGALVEIDAIAAVRDDDKSDV